ncbi:MAG: hypothetical protein AAF327_07895 [Cyanobacteria bacterium P01_A01_bin.37]
MARTKNITAHDVESARVMLQKLAAKPKTLSLKELVAELSEDINVALSQGYTYDEIAAELSHTQGISIAERTLKRHHLTASKEKESAPSKSANTDAAKSNSETDKSTQSAIRWPSHLD